MLPLRSSVNRYHWLIAIIKEIDIKCIKAKKEWISEQCQFVRNYTSSIAHVWKILNMIKHRMCREW